MGFQRQGQIDANENTCFSHRHLGMFYLRGHFTLRGICWVCLSSGTKRKTPVTCKAWSRLGEPPLSLGAGVPCVGPSEFEL